MRTFQSILVHVDAAAAAHPALDRALLIAEQSRARLKIVDVVNFPSMGMRHFTASMRELVLNSRREQLQQLAGSVGHFDVTVEVLVGRPATALIREVLAAGHDLLMRSRILDASSDTRKMYDSVDMELFRQCPCPVWAEEAGHSVPSPRIVAAIHTNPEDTLEQDLNRKIVELGLSMAQLQHGSLTILQAWTAYGESMLRVHITPEELAEYIAATEKEVARDLKSFASSFGPSLGLTRVELRKGAPEDVIPEFVASEGIHQVVMGSVARTGLSAFLIGNTAERLLQRLRCSVVTVKPDDFVSPVRL